MGGFYITFRTTAFPVRLASEIYQRCAAILTENGVNARTDYMIHAVVELTF